jgi:hypothetical protein
MSRLVAMVTRTQERLRSYRYRGHVYRGLQYNEKDKLYA